MVAGMEKGRITVRDFSFEYTWERKEIRRYNLRVKKDGEVYVSSPLRTPRHEIERFLVANADFVKEALAKVASRAARTPVLSLDEGEALPIWGVLHTVRHLVAARPRVWCENGELFLALPDPSDMAARERAFSRYARASVLEAMCAITAAHAPAFVGDAPMPPVSVRYMKSRWGTCFCTRREICYSTRLLFLPPDCLHLTACHELAHLRHPDHSAAFYATLATVLPRHKEYKRLLRESYVPTFVWEK